jgi:hypothetical protein
VVMADATVATGRLGQGTINDQISLSPIGEILRDIARGGIAGAIVGIVVGGLGGRVLMRLAAILQADAAGALTQNGNRIGDITLVGTLGLLAFGLVVGLLAGTVWVIVSPWIPGRPRTRALLTAGIAMSIGTPELIDSRNPDFLILDHDRFVVASLVALVGLIGLSIALLDGWLDRRLPHALSGGRMPTTLYAILALLWALLIFPFVLLVFLTADSYGAPLRAGFALLVVGLCTVAWWGLRVRGHSIPPRSLVVIGRVALLAAVVLGLVTEFPHISRAMGLRI